MVVLAWATTGAGVVIFSAALSAVSAELFEAAPWTAPAGGRGFRYVIFPALRSVIQLWVMILIITVFVSLFPWIFTLTRGGPGYATTTLDFDIYQNALSFGYFGTGRRRDRVPAACSSAALIAVSARTSRSAGARWQATPADAIEPGELAEDAVAAARDAAVPLPVRVPRSGPR